MCPSPWPTTTDAGGRLGFPSTANYCPMLPRVHSHAPSIRPIEGHKWLTRFPANESPRRTGLHCSLSAKSSFYLPAFEISRSCRTASGACCCVDPSAGCGIRGNLHLGWRLLHLLIKNSKTKKKILSWNFRRTKRSPQQEIGCPVEPKSLSPAIGREYLCSRML
jgi:hypothetical protein